MATAACRPAALELKLDAGDGQFSGMSHSGVLVILRNRGTRACLVPGLPRVDALDSRGTALPVSRSAPVGMHPGPVVIPVRIAPRTVVSTPLYWVTGPVFTHSRCFSPARLRVTAGAAVMQAPWAGGQVCGAAGSDASFRQPVLRPGRSMSAP